MMREDALQPRQRNNDKDTPKAAKVPADLSAAASARFERLRRWRTEQAREQGVPAYIIFDNKTLAALAELNPSTLPAVASVSGVGQRKLELYGAEILSVLEQLR